MLLIPPAFKKTAKLLPVRRNELPNPPTKFPAKPLPKAVYLRQFFSALRYFEIPLQAIQLTKHAHPEIFCAEPVMSAAIVSAISKSLLAELYAKTFLSANLDVSTFTPPTIDALPVIETWAIPLLSV